MWWTQVKVYQALDNIMTIVCDHAGMLIRGNLFSTILINEWMLVRVQIEQVFTKLAALEDWLYIN